MASPRVVKAHLGSPDVVCHCGGTGDRGLFAPQSSLSRVLTEAGVTPAVQFRGPAPLAASPAQPVSESVLAGLTVSIWAWGADTHARTKLTAYMDTLGHCGATAACTVMGPSGRAGSPVKKETSGREGHGHRQSSRGSVTMLSTCCRSNSVRHTVHPPSVHHARARERNTCVFKGVPRRVRIPRAREWTSSPHAGQTVREPCSNTVGTFRQEMDIVLVGRGFLNTSA